MRCLYRRATGVWGQAQGRRVGRVGSWVRQSVVGTRGVRVTHQHVPMRRWREGTLGLAARGACSVSLAGRARASCRVLRWCPPKVWAGGPTEARRLRQGHQ